MSRTQMVSMVGLREAMSKSHVIGSSYSQRLMAGQIRSTIMTTVLSKASE